MKRHDMPSVWSRLVLVCGFSLGCFTLSASPMDTDASDPYIEEIESSNFPALLENSTPLTMTGERELQVATALWQKFQATAGVDPKRRAEHANRAIPFGDKTMRFSMDKIGARPAAGYPLYIALHGGGGAPPSVNESQWQHMKIYYRDSVANGVYVAPRGITDTWNLHFVDESYPLYDRLIENMILFEGVDPNRVYILGFSAGGDGVYQIAPRMPDRFAAANMSAGHHNWIHFDNLHNTPFLIQMGENDSAYSRNRVAAENFLAMNQLHEQYGSGFVHDLFLHLGGSHNSWRDNDASRGLQNVIADPKNWLESRQRATKTVNSNAIDWLNQYQRTPYPKKIVWDIKTGAEARGRSQSAQVLGEGSPLQSSLALSNQLFYYLDLAVEGQTQIPDNAKIVATLDSENNRIVVNQVDGIKAFRILLNSQMLDLSRPIGIDIKDQNLGTFSASANFQTMSRTLLERGDSSYIFSSEVIVAQNAETLRWEITR